MKKVWIMLLMTMAVATATQAQRLIPGQRGLQLSVGVPLTENRLFASGNHSLELAMTINHKRANHWLFGLGYWKRNFSYRAMQIPSENVSLEAAYMLNLFSDAGKNLLLNSGVGAVVGYESLNRGKKLLPDGATLLNKDHLLYGGAYHLALELYATDQLLFFTKAKCFFLWGSETERFRPALFVGMRIML